MSEQRYIITIEAMPVRPGMAPAEIRLRQALKLLLRAFRLKCVDVREENQHQHQHQQPTEETTPP